MPNTPEIADLQILSDGGEPERSTSRYLARIASLLLLTRLRRIPPVGDWTPAFSASKTGRFRFARLPETCQLSGSPPRSPVEPPADSALLRLYGEKRANLVRFFAARLRSVVEAEDLVQDLYLKIQAAGDLEAREDGSALLFRMANNLMLDRVRGQTRASARDERWRDSQTTTLGPDPIADAPSAEEIVAGRQRLAAVMSKLQTLPPKTARAFSLHKLEGLSHVETAQAMGISRSAVEKHVSAALKALMSVKR